VSVSAHAQDDLDVTMRMVTDDEQLTNSVVRTIELPESPVASPAKQAGKRALGNHNACNARELSRQAGQAVAEQARERRGQVNGDRPGSSAPGLSRPERPKPAQPKTGSPRNGNPNRAGQ
jgi:hypothetical protein